MKRKYYLRGLGVGILITVLVFVLTGPAEISDEEIINRAEALGYVKADVQSDSLGIKELLGTVTPAQNEKTNTEELPELSNTPLPTKTPTPVPTEALETPSPIPTDIPEPVTEPTVIPIPTQTPVPTPEHPVVTATIVVERGNTATTVCNKIEAAGILEDGMLLRDYLISHNLTDSINVGSYTLSTDMSLQEIAETLTKYE